MQQRHGQHGATSDQMMRRHYMMLGVNLLISLAIMYLAMFAMIWSLGEFVQNINFFYMALVMWAPMAIVMMLTMKSMFMNSRVNMILYAAFAAVFLLSFWGIRAQALVDDRRFLESMIPHHSGALTMCNRASLRDAEVRDLCFKPNGIIQSQTREIEQMEAILRRL
jgi:hypothetical protein